MKTFIKSSNNQAIPPLKKNNTNILYFTDEEKANILNDYFLQQTQVDNSDKDVPDLGPPLYSNTLSELILTPTETELVIKSLKSDKAPGPDGINNTILKESARELSFPLCNLFNYSLQICKMPSSWKEANVTVIFKKGDPSLPSNYRPISLLNTMEKVFERLIFKHLFNHLRFNNFLSPVQSGFTPGDSTVNQLLSIYDTLCKSLDNGLEVRVIFFDISKAFDKVWHKGLLTKLKHAGLTKLLYDWFVDYLSGRSQRVVLSNAKSSFGNLSAGVPQGSILGPVLFLVFINDIVDDIQSNINLFADDTSLYLIVENPQIAATILQSDIDRISLWADTWLVSFNPSKSESLIVSRKRGPNRHPDLLLNNQSITEVSDHKHLGVFISNNCTWHSHMVYITDKAWKRVTIMRQLKFRLDRKSLETIYTSFIRPLLEYADVIWGNATKFELDELDKIQNECARIASGSTRLVSLENLSNEINWEPLEERRYIHRMVLFFKMQNGQTPDYLSSIIPPTANNRYNLRNTNNIPGIYARTTQYYNSFFPTAIREWNNLPSEVRNLPTLSSFKHHFKGNKRYTPNYFYTGDRKLQVLHTRLRTNCSSLNYHLFLKNIAASPLCLCGQIENNFHYFFECLQYETARQKLLRKLNNIDIELNVLLNGNPELSDQTNTMIFSHVHTYIQDTKRFT